ncbi:unnamed protein product [Chilo suppressalis]|uniref:CRAL-TRIO domain-containing protein n=1 Tax=Chilo suppressalis TaxID=168631 RepID=A0ABN8B1U4_CHISP|nr:hypothetical protein evm_010598 [Chilo suppressalis]CAH0399357.1 unnamed protein product [Chilo suppressalis]
MNSARILSDKNNNMINKEMRSPFLEIIFQAEISRYEDSDFEELARINCYEDPKTRSKLIQELRNMIIERKECQPHRMDDAYMLKFLRCRKFIPALAHKLMVRYEVFRRQNPEIYHCDAFALREVRNVYSGIYPESPEYGRIIIMNFGKWDTDAVTALDVLRCAAVLNEVVLEQPKMQILGITTILDMDGFGFRHVCSVNTSTVYNMINLFGIGFPLMVHGIHIINYNWFFNPFLSLMRRFIPKSIWKRIHFHGTDVSSLQKHVDIKYLPPKYGGTGIEFKSEEWFEKINIYKDECLVRTLRNLGYIIN